MSHAVVREARYMASHAFVGEAQWLNGIHRGMVNLIHSIRRIGYGGRMSNAVVREARYVASHALVGEARWLNGTEADNMASRALLEEAYQLNGTYAGNRPTLAWHHMHWLGKLAVSHFDRRPYVFKACNL
eukprot:1162075-Pelagomonas_calceolata.AAC.14